MAFADDVKSAVATIDKVYPRVSEIARQHDLSLRASRKVAKDPDWTFVLELEGTDPEYRIGFKVSLRPNREGVYVWSLVTDLPTGTWNQHIRDNVPLANLEAVVNEGLTAFEGWLKENEGIDPKEAARKLAGTAYYWSHEYHDEIHEYTADFGDDWSGSISNYDGDCEAELFDPEGDTVLHLEGNDAKELMLKIEAAFKEKNPD